MRSIYACYQMYVCLLSNVPMLTIKYTYACRYLIISIRHLKDQCASIHYSCVVDMVGL